MAAPGKYFKLFFRNPKIREKAFRKYLLLKFRYVKGESEIGFFRHVLGFQSIAIYYLTAEKVSERLNFAIPVHYVVYALPLLFLLKAIIYYGLGYLWDKNQLFHFEQEISNERNIMLSAIKEATTSAAIKQQAS